MLTSANISQQETERRTVELLYEWFKTFFTGAAVNIAGASQTLPVCDYLFGQMAVRQPAEKTQIHTILDMRPESDRHGDARLVRSVLTASVHVRTSKAGQELLADFENRRIADAVRQIFESETHPLAQKGIRHLEVQRGPVVIPSPLCVTRLLVVTGELRYFSAISTL